MDILVTGATGFIGSSLCRTLIRDGNSLRAFHRHTSPLTALEGLAVEHCLGDILDPASVAPAMEGVEVVFHCAAQMGPWRNPAQSQASHVLGTRNVLQAARRAGVRRVVHTSSVAALGVPEPGAPGDTLLDESHPWNAEPTLWPYGYAKHLAEQEVLAAVHDGLDAVIVNPAAVFGAGDVHRGRKSIIGQVARGHIPVAVAGGLNVVHIDDVVAGHLAALNLGRTGERYILGGENLSITRVLAITAEVVGRRPPRITLPGALVRSTAALVDLVSRPLSLPLTGDLLRLAGLYFYYDMEKSHRELGLPPPTPYRVAAEQAYAWFRTHAYL